MKKSKILVSLTTLCMMLMLAACGESYDSSNEPVAPIDPTPAEELADDLNNDTPVELSTVDTTVGATDHYNTIFAEL